MANTYSQIQIQIVFAVKNRACVIHPKWEDELYMYISGIIKNKGHRVLAINGMPDHIHIFIGLKPEMAVSDLVREIKKSSTHFINNRNLVSGKFQWQEGFGVFSYHEDNVPGIVNYIMNQKEHHQKGSFLNEYKDFLKEFNIEHRQEYLFHPIEDSPAD